MGYVYRYTDLSDGIIKYVGIVWSDRRELSQRIYEHASYDWWCIGRKWKIEYIETPINTRTDAEYMEAHFIALFHSGLEENGFNSKKDGWGISSFIPTEWNWVEYVDFSIPKQTCELNVCNYKKVKIPDTYKIIQSVLFGKIDTICKNIIGAPLRSFSLDLNIPNQLRNVYYKNGEYIEVIHLEKVKKRPNGNLKHIYKFSELEAKQMLEYLCRCYGYKQNKNDIVCSFEEYYDYIAV